MIFYFIIISAGGETYSRFRVPVVPYFAVLAGVGYAWVFNYLRSYGSSLKNPLTRFSEASGSSRDRR
jgi:hypothetical protein